MIIIAAHKFGRFTLNHSTCGLCGKIGLFWCLGPGRWKLPRPPVSELGCAGSLWSIWMDIREPRLPQRRRAGWGGRSLSRSTWETLLCEWEHGVLTMSFCRFPSEMRWEAGSQTHRQENGPLYLWKWLPLKIAEGANWELEKSGSVENL